MAQRHDADGQPYLAYYRNDLTTGFVWSGEVADDVQVTREMGEPIIDSFPIDRARWWKVRPFADAMLREFARQCDAWADGVNNDLVRRAALAYLHGESDPDDFTLAELADALGVDHDDVEALGDGDTTVEQADAYLRACGIDPESIREVADHPFVGTERVPGYCKRCGCSPDIHPAA
jgi:hypothetical protein